MTNIALVEMYDTRNLPIAYNCAKEKRPKRKPETKMNQLNG